jgi:hypothetical protein
MLSAMGGTVRSLYEVARDSKGQQVNGVILDVTYKAHPVVI